MAVNLISNNDARVNYTGHVRWYLPYSTESLCSSVDVSLVQMNSYFFNRISTF